MSGVTTKNKRACAAWALRKRGLSYRDVARQLGLPRYRTMLLCGRGQQLENGLYHPPQYSYRVAAVASASAPITIPVKGRRARKIRVPIHVPIWKRIIAKAAAKI